MHSCIMAFLKIEVSCFWRTEKAVTLHLGHLQTGAVPVLCHIWVRKHNLLIPFPDLCPHSHDSRKPHFLLSTVCEVASDLNLV